MIGIYLIIQMVIGYIGAFYFLFHKPEWLTYIFFIFAALNTIGLAIYILQYEDYSNF